MSGLRGAFERTMPFDLEEAPELVRDPQPPRGGIEIHVPPRAVLPKPYRMPAVGPLEAGEARLLPELTTAEETLEGLIEAVGECLHRVLRTVLAAASLEAVRQSARSGRETCPISRNEP